MTPTSSTQAVRAVGDDNNFWAEVCIACSDAASSGPAVNGVMVVLTAMQLADERVRIGPKRIQAGPFDSSAVASTRSSTNSCFGSRHTA